MKIDPCPCVISLKDGSVHTLFEFRHFLELVEDYMGYDAAKWLRTHVEQAERPRIIPKPRLIHWPDRL